MRTMGFFPEFLVSGWKQLVSSPDKSVDKVFFLVKVDTNGELVLEWDEMKETISKLELKQSQPIGFISVVGQPKSGKTTLINKVLHHCSEIKTEFPSHDTTHGVQIRTVPIVFEDKEDSIVLFCLDISSDGKDSRIYRKLVHFCTCISSSLIVIYGGAQKIWADEEFKKTFFQHRHSPLPRKVSIVHTDVLQGQEDTVPKILPTYKCTSGVDLLLRSPHNDTDKLRIFMRDMSLVFSTCHSFVLTKLSNPMKEFVDGKGIANSAVFKGPALKEDGRKVCVEHLETVVKQSCSELSIYCRRLSKSPSTSYAKFCSTERGFNQHEEYRVTEILDNVLEAQQNRFIREFQNESQEFSKKMGQFISDTGIDALKKIREASPNLKESNVVKGIVDEKLIHFTSVCVAYQKTSALMKIAYQYAVSEFLQRLGLALAKGQNIEDATRELVTFHELVASNTGEIHGHDKEKEHLNAKVKAFEKDFTKVSAQLCSFQDMLATILKNQICVKTEKLNSIKSEWVAGACRKIELHPASVTESKISLENILESMSALMFSRFEVRNATNMELENILSKETMSRCLEAYKAFMQDAVRNCYFTSENFRKLHSCLVTQVLNVFVPSPGKFLTSFIWEDRIFELKEVMEALYENYAKVNSKNCISFDTNCRKFVTKCLNVYKDEVSEATEGNLHAKAIRAKGSALKVFDEITENDKATDSTPWRAELEEAIRNVPETKIIWGRVFSPSPEPAVKQDQCSPLQLSSVKGRGYCADAQEALSTHEQSPGPCSSKRLNDTSPGQNQCPSKKHQLNPEQDAVSQSTPDTTKDPLKLKIIELINTLNGKLSSSGKVPEAMKNYIRAQVKEASDLLKHASPKEFHLRKTIGVLEMALEKV